VKLIELEAAAEAVLFAAGDAVSLPRIALAIGQDVKTTKSIMGKLMDKYHAEKRGIELIEVSDSYQLRTNAKYYDAVRLLLQNPQKKSLTPPLMETLAIIAYRQPVTKPQIEEIRGVDAAFAVNRLVELGLVCEKGRDNAPGKPILFGTTDDFLKHFGFSALVGLPGLPEMDEQLRLEAETEADEILP